MNAARSSTATATTAIADSAGAAPGGETAYRGRFAPSPTGPLHFGSLLAAVGSFLEARTRGGLWFLRMENVDRTREVPGAADLILHTLDRFGFDWDGPVVIQSERTEAYLAALNTLQRAGRTFACSCSRSELGASLAGTTDERRYPGTCRTGPLHPERPLAIRFRVSPERVSFTDRIQGRVTIDVAALSGDFVIRRRDGYIAYQLAVVVDDAAGGVTDVVRGADLLDSTPKQLLLQQALGLPAPGYAHLPLAVDSAGAKLSKSLQSLAIDADRAGMLLWQALAILKQQPPAELQAAAVPEIWAWARIHWSLRPLQGLQTVAAPLP